MPATISQQDRLLAGFWFAARCAPGNGTAKAAFEIPHEVLRGDRATRGLRAPQRGEMRGIARIGLKQRPEIADAAV